MDPNVSSIYDNPDLKSARSAYEGATKSATEAEAAGYSLPDQLRSALNAKFSKDNPMVKERESALTNYLNTTTSAPLSVTPTSAGGTAPVVLNPLQQADLIQRKKSSALSGLTTANDLLALATGGVNNIVDSASRAYQGTVAKKQGAAKIAGESYTNILNELAQRANEATQVREEAFKEKQFQESIRQFNVSEANKRGGSTSEQNAKAALQRDVSRNTRFDELYDRYSGDLPEYVIREAYNAGPMAQKWGKAKETSSELISRLAMAKTVEGRKKAEAEAQVIPDMRSALEDINLARERLKTSGSGQTYGIRLWTGDKNATATNAVLATLNTKLFEIAGKAFTGTERKILEGKILDIKKQEGNNTAALNEAERLIKKKLKEKGINLDNNNNKINNNDPLGLF